MIENMPQHNEENRSMLLEKYEKMAEKYKSIYDNSPDLYRTINMDGTIIDCNATYADRLGYSKSEVIGRTIFDHAAQDSIAALHSIHDAWRKTGVAASTEIWLKRKDNSVFPVLRSSANMYGKDGRLEGCNITMRDITYIHNAKREIEEHKLKSLNAIGDLSARISHDFRNPISIIRNSLELMKIQNPDLNEKNRNHITVMERAIARISHQLEEVLDYVLPRPLEIGTSSLSDILDSALSKIDLGETRVELPEKDHTISCDGSKMEIVFSNLILNAVQAMGKKGSIRIRATDTPSSTTIEIEDTGPGIPEHLVGRMFEPLFTTRQIGTGLGLVSCKSIIEKHGGTITIRTQIGKGTAFIIMLPKRR